MSETVFLCPHCGHEDDHCDFVEDRTEYRTEWGTYDGSDYEYHDSETNDSEGTSLVHKCPNCENDVDSQETFYDKGSAPYLAELKRLKNEGCIPEEEPVVLSNE